MNLRGSPASTTSSALTQLSPWLLELTGPVFGQSSDTRVSVSKFSPTADFRWSVDRPPSPGADPGGPSRRFPRRPSRHPALRPPGCGPR